jgi:phosphoketolase
VLRSPKGWTGPENVDGVQVTDSWRAHQVPLSGVKGNPEHLAILQKWMTSYRPEDLFDDVGAPVELVLSNVPDGDLRMSAAPSANGGKVSKPLKLRVREIRRRSGESSRADEPTGARGDDAISWTLQLRVFADETTRTVSERCSKSPTAASWNT